MLLVLYVQYIFYKIHIQIFVNWNTTWFQTEINGSEDKLFFKSWHTSLMPNRNSVFHILENAYACRKSSLSANVCWRNSRSIMFKSLFFPPCFPCQISEAHLHVLTYWDFHSAGLLLTILGIRYYLVIQPARMARLGCAQWICKAAVLKSLTGAEMRVSIKTDPGWSLLVAKLRCRCSQYRLPKYVITSQWIIEIAILWL